MPNRSTLGIQSPDQSPTKTDMSPTKTDLDEDGEPISPEKVRCVTPTKAVPIIYKFMDYAYPDFGHADPLSFLLRSDTDIGESYSVWEYMYNYIAGKSKFQRFNNVVEDLARKKNTEMMKKIHNMHEKVKKQRGNK